MKHFRPNRREWMLLLFPVALLGLSQLEKFRSSNLAELGFTVNPLAQRQEEQRRNVCRYNLRQFHLSLQMYVGDNDGRFPPASRANQGWVLALNPSSWNSGLLRLPCPALASINPISRVPQYWINSNLWERGGRGVVMDHIRQPSQTFFMGDGDPSLATVNYSLNQTTWHRTASYATLHREGSNYSFVDGHIKWLKSGEVDVEQFTLRNSKMAR